MSNKLIILVISLIAGSIFLYTSRQQASPGKPISTPVPEPSEIKQSTSCTNEPTPAQTEGPYYKIGSPQRNNISQDIIGEKLIVAGFVFDKNCKPFAGAWLDFWQADASGQYDNVGFKLRGHQFTDSSGQFTLETIVPAAYESRPPHIHVKVKASNGPTLTSQLYFSAQTLNQTDSIFNPALVMDVTEKNGSKVGKFNFVLSQ